MVVLRVQVYSLLEARLLYWNVQNWKVFTKVDCAIKEEGVYR